MNKLKNIRIRMYRQGLGDCFLLTFNYGNSKKYHILIDCGVILGTDNAELHMTEVAEDIDKETGGNIDIVVVTHEHWDHLSGFKQAQSVFDRIHFQDVWMAWTEDPGNDLANKLRKIRAARKKAILNSFDSLNAELDQNQFLTPEQKTSRRSYLNAVAEIASFTGGIGAAGGFSTNDALEYVKSKTESKLYFCSPEAEPFTLNDIDGLRVYILGPPLDEKLLKKDFSKKEVYSKIFMTDFGEGFLNAMIRDEDDTIYTRFLPFDRCTGDNIETDKSLIKDYYEPENDWRRIDNDWMDFAGQLSLALDSDTNNTSLVLAFELIDKEKFLLFAADAQYGNWESWHNYKWNVKNKNGEDEDLDIKKIFERTIFYKTGHHGSHNATLSNKGLELMTNKELCTVIPVDKKMARKKGWNMPFPPLLKRLNEKCLGRVLLADEGLKDNAPKPPNISSKAWKDFTKAADCCNLYLDFIIDA